MSRDFFNDVFEVVRLVPRGRVTTYGAIAAYLGLRSGARMVGWAMNTAHNLSDIPAHRVVNRQGLLTGKMHFSPPELMEKLLLEEGVSVINDKVIDFGIVFWDPAVELG